MQVDAAVSASDIIEICTLLEATRVLQGGRPDRCDKYIPVFNALKSAGRRGLPQVQLAAALGFQPARVSRLIDLMEPQGFIVRQDHPLDRRVKVIQLTALGRERLAAAEADSHARCLNAFGQLTAGEIASLKNMLSRLVR